MAIGRLLARLGLVRIADYGLVLTPDNRILSTRPAVLDDGLGGKIVGWDEGDLAAMELERWQPIGVPGVAGPKPSPAKLIALPPPPPKMAKVLPGISPVAGVQAVAAVQAPVAAPLPALIAPPAPVQVAPAAATEDDDWEWEIAVAKARAEADPIPADNWPKTQELREDVKRWEPEPPPRHLVMPHQRVTHVPARPNRMPSGTAKQDRPTRLETTTKVRPVVTLRTPEPSKFEAKTSPAEKPFTTEQPTRRVTMVETAPKVAPKKVEPVKPAVRQRASSKHEETIRTYAAPPANDDRTDTAIALPPAPVVESAARDMARARSASVPTSASRHVAQRQR